MPSRADYRAFLMGVDVRMARSCTGSGRGQARRGKLSIDEQLMLPLRIPPWGTGGPEFKSRRSDTNSPEKVPKQFAGFVPASNLTL